MSRFNYNLEKRIRLRYRHQGDFARDVGECDTVVSRVLHGRRTISAEKWAAWAEVLKCKPESIAPASELAPVEV